MQASVERDESVGPRLPSNTDRRPVEAVETRPRAHRTPGTPCAPVGLAWGREGLDKLDRRVAGYVCASSTGVAASASTRPAMPTYQAR